MANIDENVTMHPGESFSSSSGKDFGGRQVEEVAEKTGHGVRPYLTGHKEQLVQQLNDTASALHQAGNQLSNHRSSDLFRKSAERIGRLSDYLEVHDIDELMDDFKSYATQRPWLVMGGAFVVGMAAARFFKASDRSPTVV